MDFRMFEEPIDKVQERSYTVQGELLGRGLGFKPVTLPSVNFSNRISRESCYS